MQNTNKSKKIIKVVAAVSSLALVSAVSFGATLAYLNAKTNDKTNVFTGGKVDITVKENFPNADTNHSISYTPGEKFTKEPNIELNTGSEDAYLAATVTFEVQQTDGTYSKISYDEFKKSYGKLSANTDNDSNGFDDAWILNSEDASDGSAILYYAKEGNLTKIEKDNIGKEDGTTSDIFNGVTINQDIKMIEKDGKDIYPDIRITVNGYAVQADNLTSSLTDGTALEQLNNLIKDATKTEVTE